MIITEEVKEAVDKESPEFIVKADVIILRLGCSLWDADHDVTKESGRIRRATVIHRKRKHVGRLVYRAIPGVKAPHPYVAYE